jgi:hypothetical protein
LTSFVRNLLDIEMITFLYRGEYGEACSRDTQARVPQTTWTRVLGRCDGRHPPPA